jgi:predicted nuclease of restriction endonuclease-like (RecB) superfamily
MNINLPNTLFKNLSQIIEQGKKQVAVQVNSAITVVYWQVGYAINNHILENKRADYGKLVVPTIANQLVINYGKSFEEKNLRRMMQFAEVFAEFEIVVTLSRQLNWSHFLNLIPLKKEDARVYYAQKIAEEQWSVREARNQIERKAFERQEIANVEVSLENTGLTNTFKNPYFLDFLGLKEGYLENDLEGAVIKEIEHFILELGKGFTFIERQKRMIIDGEDFYLDLLFYNRKLKRLVAIELKLGKFKVADKGQMELYLKWLDKYEKQEGENNPIGLILCVEKSSEQVELLQMHKDGIMVAEYWTELPTKKELEKKLHSLVIEVKARFENNKLLKPKK